METCSTLVEFIDLILHQPVLNKATRVYRGHDNSSHLLKPSIFRQKAYKSNEHILIRELVASHPSEFSDDQGALGLLVRMQHYSLPTRLLDVSWNPLVGLYFACQPRKRRILRKINGKTTTKSVEADGQVVCIEATESRIKYFDSDTVCILANLSQLSNTLKERINTSLEFTEFNRDLPIRRLLHLVRQEKSSFEPEIEPNDLDSIFLVKPRKNNRRILAQDGAFFVFGQSDQLRETDEGFRIRRIQIPADAKEAILSELDKIAVNDKNLFPELDRAAQYLIRQVGTTALIEEILSRGLRK